MPIFKNRSQHVKVFRPGGLRYAEGRAITVNYAIASALANFYMEFGEVPKQSYTVFEVIGTTGQWIAQVFEVKEDPSKEPF